MKATWDARQASKNEMTVFIRSSGQAANSSKTGQAATRSAHWMSAGIDGGSRDAALPNTASELLKRSRVRRATLAVAVLARMMLSVAVHHAAGATGRRICTVLP